MDTQEDNMFPSLSDGVLNNDYEKKQCTFKSARFLTKRYNPIKDRNKEKNEIMSPACKMNLPVPGSSRTLQGDTRNYRDENKSPTTSFNQSSDYNSIPCNQAQHVSVDEIGLENFDDNVAINTIFGSPTKLSIDHGKQLNTSPNVISTQILDENLSASTLASFEKSFHTSRQDNTTIIADNRELNNTMFQSFDVTDLSQLHKSSNFRNEIMDTFNVCEMSVCQLNDTIGMIKDKDNVESKHRTFMDESNDSFMLNVPLNISKIHEFIKPNPVSNRPDVNNYFYGLPLLAKTLVSQYKGIDKLYGTFNFYMYASFTLT